jgi:hypothetical protein
MMIETCSDTPLHNKTNAGKLILILFSLVDIIVVQVALLTLFSGNKPDQLAPISRACFCLQTLKKHKGRIYKPSNINRLQQLRKIKNAMCMRPSIYGHA